MIARPSEWARAARKRADPNAAVARGQHYFAFLSYSHRDETIARWLHDSLEKFRVPRHLVGRLTEHGPVPRRLTPIFRDLGELPASDDLGSEIREAIAGSRFLIVLCSPAAAESWWTNAEIEAFKRVRPEGCILAGIVSGEPFASEMPGREAEECLPPALRYHYDKRGRRTSRRAEPLAADLREGGEARRLGLLKIVAGVLGLGLDELVQRETLRRQRRLGLIAAASLAGMIVTSGLAVTAIQARDAARDQRREAEGLIGFMLGDLRSKLEPVGRLDALDGVGSRVLTYYQNQDMAELSDAALLQRSRALTLMGEVASRRGNIDGALQLYREAFEGTSEAMRRAPNDPQRLFDHAQNVFWLGEIARQRGQVGDAEAASREYQRLARRMVALEPDNMKWRMETQYADVNLGIMLYEQRRFAEAARQFEQALQTIEALATADSANSQYQRGLAETLAWLADAQMSLGRLEQAVDLRERNVALLKALIARAPGDVGYRQMLISAERALGNLHFSRGQPRAGLDHLSAAVGGAERLIPLERSNSLWIELGATAQLNFAELLLLDGQRQQAAVHAAAGCTKVEHLLAGNRSVANWRTAHRDCLTIRARLALESGSADEALQRAQEALAAARSAASGDPVADRFAVVKVHRLIGDVRSRSGDSSGARASWREALGVLPRGSPERPSEMNERAQLLERVGRIDEARPIAARLQAIGYRRIG